MQYMLLIYSNENEFEKPGAPERDSMLKEYMDFSKSIAQSGHYRAGNELHPTTKATTVRVRGLQEKLLTAKGAKSCRNDAKLGFGWKVARRQGFGSLLDGMTIEQIYREESGRILATLIRLLGDFDLAEEALQEAFAAALAQWPSEGIPASPRAWLVSTGRNKAVDRLRRRARFEAQSEELERLAGLADRMAEEPEESMLSDDRLRLIFTCCHPALSTEAQVSLTLRTLCGLSTEEIARAFLVPAPTMAQRIVRAKQKIRDANIPYRVPDGRDLAQRLDAVMLVIYLVFNEGYAASSGDSLVRRELCQEAIHLGRILCE